MKKLSKQQKEFFQSFVRETIVGIVSQISGEETAGRLPAVADIILKESLAVGNLDHIVDAFATAMLDKVDFKTLKKVDAFMKSEDYVKVMMATHNVVFAEYREDFMNLVAAVSEVSEKAIKSAAAQAEGVQTEDGAVEVPSTEGEQAV
jgi:hypothetical protein